MIAAKTVLPAFTESIEGISTAEIGTKMAPLGDLTKWSYEKFQVWLALDELHGRLSDIRKEQS
jgi:hypothetical protein